MSKPDDAQAASVDPFIIVRIEREEFIKMVNSTPADDRKRVGWLSCIQKENVIDKAHDQIESIRQEMYELARQLRGQADGLMEVQDVLTSGGR